MRSHKSGFVKHKIAEMQNDGSAGRASLTAFAGRGACLALLYGRSMSQPIWRGARRRLAERRGGFVERESLARFSAPQGIHAAEHGGLAALLTFDLYARHTRPCPASDTPKTTAKKLKGAV